MRLIGSEIGRSVQIGARCAGDSINTQLCSGRVLACSFLVIAEEVISTICAVQAFGTQNSHAQLYDNKVNRAHWVKLKKAAFYSGNLVTVFFITYSGYALTFLFGVNLINQGKGEIQFVAKHLPTNPLEIQELLDRL